MAIEYVVLEKCPILDTFGAETLLHFSLRTQQVEGLTRMLKNQSIEGEEALDKSITLREYIDDTVQTTTLSLRSMMEELKPFEEAAQNCEVHGHSLKNEQARWGTIYYPISASIEMFFVNLMSEGVAHGGECNNLFDYLKENEITFLGDRHAEMRRYGRDDDKPKPQTELEEELFWLYNDHEFTTDQLFEFLFFQEKMTPEQSGLLCPFIPLIPQAKAALEMIDREIPPEIDQYFKNIEKSYTKNVAIVFKT